MLKTLIPYIDLRGRTPADLLRAYPDVARQLVRASRRAYGGISYVISAGLLPFSDRASHRWLMRNRNPYLYEIETFCDILRTPGVISLNLSYEWGCTTAAFRSQETVSLMRTLDWPFPALGRHAMVVLQSGKGGDYYNITWPGMSGVFSAMAPDRFAAVINQAPMRKIEGRFMRDWIKGRRMVQASEALPPSHLLRMVFDNARNYDEAKSLLANTPLATPVIYVLTGTKAGEGCVIERLEEEAVIRELQADMQVSASNHFEGKFAGYGNGWWPRANDSPARYKQCLTLLAHDVAADHFDWLRPPILNRDTRIAFLADAGTHRLVVQGFEGPRAVTEPFILRRL